MFKPRIVTIVVLLAGCSAMETTRRSEPSEPTQVAAVQPESSHWSGPTEEETNDRRARPYIEGMRALERLRAGEGCEDPNVGIILARIAELAEMSGGLRKSGSFRQHADTARARHARLAFDFADEALERGCLDLAEEVYRGLMGFYDRPDSQDIRDRAAQGLALVRSRAATSR